MWKWYDSFFYLAWCDLTTRKGKTVDHTIEGVTTYQQSDRIDSFDINTNIIFATNVYLGNCEDICLGTTLYVMRQSGGDEINSKHPQAIIIITLLED